MTTLDIYRTYPRHIAKLDAIKAIEKAVTRLRKGERDGILMNEDCALAFLLSQVKSFASAVYLKDRQFIPHPATWFNRGSYLDDPAEWKTERSTLGMYTGPKMTDDEVEALRRRVQ